jgi:hypothetical protein
LISIIWSICDEAIWKNLPRRKGIGADIAIILLDAAMCSSLKEQDYQLSGDCLQNISTVQA